MTTQEILQGVHDWTNGKIVYDISAAHPDGQGNPTPYADLTAALGTGGVNIPEDIRKGGMSIKFIQDTINYTVVKTEGVTEEPTGTEIQNDPSIESGTYKANQLSAFSALPTTPNSSLTYYLAVTETVDEQEVTTYTTWVITYVQSSDNNYVQYRLMADEFTTDVTQWQGVEDEPTVDSKNLVSSSGIKTNLLELCYRSKEKKASQSLFASGQYSKIVESSTDIKGVTCEVVAGQKYHIKKSNVTDSFIVCIMTMPPNEWENSMKQSYPLFKEVNGETTEIDIVSPSNGWMLIGYTRSGESCEITVNSEDFYVLDRCTCYISDFVCNASGTKIITTHGTSTSRGFYFPCKAGKTYVVVKSKASNRFRVTFLTTAPADWYVGLVPEIPKIVNYDNSDKLEFEFNAPNDGYIIICTSNLRELINLFVFEVTNMIQPKILSDGYVLREMPINPEWDKWDDIRYYWGFDINAQREFNTIKGVLESDTMLSVRGGKGRWSGGADFSGGHVFEGWSGNELFRLTMLIGKFKESLACIQVYSPKGLYQTDAKRFGWVKIGSDNNREGVDFGKSNTIFYTPLTLQSRASAPESVPDYDLHPVLSDNTILDGTMYYDTTLKKVRVKVNGEWKNVMLES